MTRAAWSPPKSDTCTQGAADRQLTRGGSRLLRSSRLPYPQQCVDDRPRSYMATRRPRPPSCRSHHPWAARPRPCARRGRRAMPPFRSEGVRNGRGKGGIRNDSHPAARRRSTMSHELAHVVGEHTFGRAWSTNGGAGSRTRSRKAKRRNSPENSSFLSKLPAPYPQKARPTRKSPSGSGSAWTWHGGGWIQPGPASSPSDAPGHTGARPAVDRPPATLGHSGEESQSHHQTGAVPRPDARGASTRWTSRRFPPLQPNKQTHQRHTRVGSCI
jgi:hypothetical protein